MSEKEMMQTPRSRATLTRRAKMVDRWHDLRSRYPEVSKNRTMCVIASELGVTIMCVKMNLTKAGVY